METQKSAGRKTHVEAGPESGAMDGANSLYSAFPKEQGTERKYVQFFAIENFLDVPARLEEQVSNPLSH